MTNKLNYTKLEDNILRYLNASCMFITISFGALIYAHDSKNKNKLYSLLLIVIACIGTISSLIINILLTIFLNKYKDNKQFYNIYKWFIVNTLLYIIHIILISLSGYTLYKSLYNYN